ncbi:MAG TPA: TIGR03435 family protein [Vicinamibacterales bacterium]|nr:TIGR03435 family protein [Vicinamibacterales bacterium]
MLCRGAGVHLGRGRGSPAEERPAFHVVSVKPNTSGEPGLHLGVVPGRFRAINFPLAQFIRAAYTLQVYQIAGAPSWVESDRFDIIGLSDRDLTAPVVWTPGRYAPLQLMMQSVLADRFKLVAHFEQRKAQMYALVRLSPGSARDALAQTTLPCPANCGMKIGPGTLNARGVRLAGDFSYRPRPPRQPRQPRPPRPPRQPKVA